jgi:uncharacterized repeat protein (TIGR01451 family)
LSLRRPAGVLAALVLAASCSVLIAGPAHATAIVVNTNDGFAQNNNNCSLHEAIKAASENTGTNVDQCPAGSSTAVDTITFDTSSWSSPTISPSAELPTINGNTVIDAVAGGTPSVTISGSLMTGDTALTLANGGHTIRGLILISFDVGIRMVSNSNGNRVEYSRITNNGIGIEIQGNNNVIGNADPLLSFQARNVISSNSQVGINISGGVSGNSVVGNYIGTSIEGTSAAPNKQGVVIRGANNTIGGSSPHLGNVISGNTEEGVFIIKAGGSLPADGTGNVVAANWIGTDSSGTLDLGNGKGGVALTGGDNTIGSTDPEVGNTIAFNGFDGVAVTGGTPPVGNSILANSIYSNDALGIDLGPDGVTQNDGTEGGPWDIDTGANNLQNFPTISNARPDFGSAGASDDSTHVNAQLLSVADTTFRVDLYYSENCDPSGNGEGQHFLGASHIITDGTGEAILSETYPVGVEGEQFITATATRLAAGEETDTSEFSPCFQVPSADLRVEKSGPATVRVSKKVTYTITVTNNGPDTVLAPMVTDKLSANGEMVTFTSSGGEQDICQLIGREVSCQLAPLGEGNSNTLLIVARPLVPGNLVNKVSTSSDVFDPDLSNNKDALSTQATCDIKGNANNNTLEGTRGDDIICGLGGNDKILGKGGKDFIVGGGGDDTIEGGLGADKLYGNAGKDAILGGDGNDYMNGGGGTDTCKQGAGSGIKVSCEKP